ncbi:recombinase family protein [Belnapia sp. T6]|uniref:Recombinase family protein n=1 Tax=Belnapia mucosa TaxID=2804532 RepID=A0ABS1VAT6_9PROT|nr:recombinase family protein [Belnapia mucosa]
MEPDRVFRDHGYSGASLRRPGLDRLRNAVAAARFERILMTAPDRLARNFVHQCCSLRSCRNTVLRWCSLIGR